MCVSVSVRVVGDEVNDLGELMNESPLTPSGRE